MIKLKMLEMDEVKDKMLGIFNRGGGVAKDTPCCGGKQLPLQTREFKTLSKVLNVLHNENAGMFTSVFYPTFSPGCCDYCERERVANVVTSLPFLLAGAHIIKNSKDVPTRRWGKSVVGAGVASGLFHSFLRTKNPRLKSVFRRLDYSAVCLGTAMAVKALQIPVPSAYSSFSAITLPLNPFLLGGVNTLMIERKYFQHAVDKPELRKEYAMHVISTAVAASAFVTEDYRPHFPFIHSLWHMAAALATVTVLPMANVKKTIKLPIVGQRRSIDYPPTFSPKARASINLPRTSIAE